ncbi:hypothetical protein IF1G_11351 [Cordyceps javanica]|uniref:Uncharacterized protein n=1 Tax=Cordyceps javanica TaxID=43265 RepID=A0A545UKK4_9HYPO|nr:hypothetical protein IF1G_11351 [Cordyceps javanica]
MTVLTRHSRRQKEAVRKRGPSLRGKAQQLGLKGNIRVIVIQEDPTHALEEYDRTGQAPRVRPCRKYASAHHNARKVSVHYPQDDEVSDDEVSDDETVAMSMGSTESDSADIQDVGSENCVVFKGFGEGAEKLKGHLDDDPVMVDQMIKMQLEETGSQMHRRLLRWIWKS